MLPIPKDQQISGTLTYTYLSIYLFIRYLSMKIIQRERMDSLNFNDIGKTINTLITLNYNKFEITSSLKKTCKSY